MALWPRGLRHIVANAGYRGHWAELDISCRFLQVVVPFARGFAEEFLGGEGIDVPRGNQMELGPYPVELRWLQVRHPQKELRVYESELLRMMKRLHHDCRHLLPVK
ncbi:MAG: hypothetical protein OXI44_03490 [Bacteroidota bacterium]|nr:hypothetical protein [Bacteroidota bacterium]